MKSILRITVLLVVALVANYSIVSAKSLRVNNNAGVTPVTGVLYETLPLAYAAAVAGDTLIIEGSNTSYGDQIIIKKLTIFGPGYYLSDNSETQASVLSVQLGNITYNVGSDGSLISGCKINSVTVNESNITISRNIVQNSTATAASIALINNITGIYIQQNIVWGLINNTSGKTISVVLRNNLLGYILFTSTVTALIDHNTFTGECSQTGGYAYAIDVWNSTVVSNIVYHYYNYYYGTFGQIKFDELQNNTISYNVFSQAAPAANTMWTNNKPAIDMSTVFTTPSGSKDKNYILKGGSAADVAGQDAKDCGMFGGNYAYVLSGMPPIPHIYMLNADPAGTNTDPLSVKISVKSQN